MGNKRKAPSEIDKYSDASSGYFSALDQTDFEDVGPASTAAQSMQTASQPNPVAPALKPWILHPSVDVVPQSQLLFLQPVMATGDCTSQRSDKPKHSRKCGPMQKTFPKIVPHLAYGSTVDLGPGAINKKSNHSGKHQRHRHDDKPFHSLKQNETFEGYDVHPTDVPWGELNQTGTDMGVEDSLSRLSELQEPHTTTSPFSLNLQNPQKSSKATVPHSSDVEDIPEVLSPSSSKHKRFCNTYNILNNSGLLGITLRTKELIRQNKRSQAQLQSLQAQTDLFLEAICSGDPKAWTRLQLNLQSPGDRVETVVESKKDVGTDITAVGCMM